MIPAGTWQAANRALVAKILGECTYEERLDPRPTEDDAFKLVLASGVTYRFQARKTPWTWLRVDPASVTREGQPVTSAVQLLIDARPELGLDPIVLGPMIEAVQNTLYSDLRRREQLEGYPAAKLVDLPGPYLEALLDGHPKLIANKGRLGWGTRALARYAPEAQAPLRLQHVAIDRDRVTLATRAGVTASDLLDQTLDSVARGDLEARMDGAGVSLDSHVVAPVHPWQWQRFILPQYAELLASGDLVDLGQLGDRFLPRQSIRTLANVSRPGRLDIKLALTILNTSCYRGIPGQDLGTGVEVSRWLATLTDQDPVLAEAALVCLPEIAGLHCPHPRQAQVDGAPYRYHEMLGAVWRESIEAHLAPDQMGLLLSTLVQTDAQGRALVVELIERSGLEPETWIRQLFEVTTVPLYHLMCRYGVGLVAHGQNVSLILEDHRPARGVIKDLHGDLRLVGQDLPEMEGLDPGTRRSMTRLSPRQLRHDLITGHLVTTLRFISPLMEERLGLPEDRFYAILAETLQAYMAEHPELEDRYGMFPLFTERLERVLVNSVRFRIGYGDRSQRPVPELGTPIPNPLAQGAGP